MKARKILLVSAISLILLSACAAPTAPPSTEEKSPAETVTPTSRQITKSGIITQNETWSGEIFIPQGVEVAEGITLTIEPGTVVKFKHWRYGYTEPSERSALVVRGTLRAIGTAEKPIRFTSDAPDPKHKDWQGIIFYQPSVDSILDYCIIEYCHNVFATDADFTLSNSIVRWIGNIAFMRSSPTITHNRIYGGMYGAIEMEGYSYPTITYNTIWHTVNGIFVSVNSHAIIRHNIIKDTISSVPQRNNGILITSNSSATIEYNTVTNSHTGISVFSGCQTSKITLRNNNIYHNDMNVQIETDEDLVATGNWWGTADKKQIESKLTELFRGKLIYEPCLTSEADIGHITYDYQNDETYPYEACLNCPRIVRDGIGEDDYVYIYPNDDTREILDLWHAGEGAGFVSGIAWDGRYIWVCTFGGLADIRKLDTSGNLLDVFPSPGPWPYGLAFDGQYLWCLDYSEAKVYQLDSSAKVIKSIPAPGKNPIGLAYDGEYLWTMPWDGTGTAYRIDTSGNVVDSIPTPGWSGLAWDGEHLWVSNGEHLRIYEMDISDGRVIGVITSPGEKTWDLTWQDSYLWACEWANEIEADQRIIKLLPIQEIIAIDGLRNDWRDFPLLVSDPKGDALDEKTDIKAVYSFTDNRYFYLMIEVYADDVGQFDHVGVQIDLDHDGKPEFKLDSARCRGEPEDRAWGIGAGITDLRQAELKYSYRKWAPFLYAHSNMKDVFEFKVPLTFIEDHSEFDMNCSLMDESSGQWLVLDETDWVHVSKR
jgi:hypothetical protein